MSVFKGLMLLNLDGSACRVIFEFRSWRQVGSCIWDQHGLAAKLWSQLKAGAAPRINIFPRLHQHMFHLLPTCDAMFQ